MNERTKRWAFRVGLALFWLVTLEGLCFGALSVLRTKGYFLRNPPATGPISYERYLETRRPVVGWPFAIEENRFGGKRFDQSGARRSPAYPDPDAQPACASAYGDSFVQAVDVDDEAAWANQLAKRLGCRVANFGRAGYGPDQAYLAYRLNQADSAPIVFLGHMHENILRNLNRVRDLITGGRDYNIKPRFILDPAGRLKLIPAPDLTLEQYERVVGIRDPMLRLPYENFQPGGDYVAPRIAFPFMLTALRSFHDYHIQTRIHGQLPFYADFYQPGHPAGGLELTAAIFAAFRRDAILRHQRPIVLLLPHSETMRHYLHTRRWVHQPLLDLLDKSGAEYLDFAPYLVEHLKDPEHEPYAGHFNNLGNALLADFVAEALRKHGQGVHGAHE